MKSKIGIIILITFLFQSAYAEKSFRIAESIISSCTSIPLSSFLSGDEAVSGSIPFKKSGYYSNSELSKMLCGIGLKDFILIGNGLKLELIKTLSDNKNVMSALEEKLNNDEASSVLANINLPSRFSIRNIDWNNDPLVKTGIIHIIDLTKPAGSALEIPFSIALKNQPAGIQAPENTIAGTAANDSPTLNRIANNMADLVYHQGALTIVSKVRIIRQLDNDTFLVENIRSGRKFQAVRYNGSSNLEE